MGLRLLAICLLVFLSAAADAQIYKHVDSNGVTHYSSMPPRDATYKVLRIKCNSCRSYSKVNWHEISLKTDEFAAEILDACKRYGVDEALVRAVIHAESWFQVKAKSDVGAQGLMQLMPDTAKRYGVRDAFDPRQNIAGGVQYLRFLLDLFDNDYSLVAAAYNAGEGAVKRYGGVPPYNETQNFVERVKILRRRYAKALS